MSFKCLINWTVPQVIKKQKKTIKSIYFLNLKIIFGISNKNSGERGAPWQS